MKFKYTRRETSKPIFTLGNATHRYRPLIEVKIIGPDGNFRFRKAKLDSGSDDTLFPHSLAIILGIDLAHATEQEGEGVGGQKIKYRCAEVELEITDHNETFAWSAVVGFSNVINRHLLGHAGMLQYFTVSLLGNASEEESGVIIEPNPSFPGRKFLRRKL